MRHRSARKRLNRSCSHRAALERNFICSLLRHERVVTTLAKAKALRPKIEKFITMGKQKDLVRLRHAVDFLRDEEVAHKLFDDIGPRFKDRPGGYTRILKCGFRPGDAAPMAFVELVDRPLPDNDDDFDDDFEDE